MTPKQKIIRIRLAEKIAKNPDCAKDMGIEIKQKINDKRSNL